MLATCLIFVFKVYHQQVPRLRKANQGGLEGQGPGCHVLLGDLNKGPSGKSEAPFNEAPGHPLSPPICGEWGLQFCCGFQVLGINHFHFHPWQKRSAMLLGKWGPQRGWDYFSTALLKLHCKAAEVHRRHASRAVFPLGHVLEGIAGRKSSWMSKFNRSASHYSSLSLTPVSPSLPLSLPLDKICLVGDMFHLRRYSDLNTHLPVNHRIFIFMVSMVPHLQSKLGNKFTHLRMDCLACEIYLA